MTTKLHADATSIHLGAIVSSVDPGVQHGRKMWVDTSLIPFVLKIRNATDNGWDNISSGGGGVTPGASIVRAFPFAYNTPGILTGAAVYTPTIGDILLDAWVEIGTAWDGTTPHGDVGQFGGMSNGEGWWANSWGDGLDMTAVSDSTLNNGGRLPALSSVGALSIVVEPAQIQVSGTNVTGVFPPNGLVGTRGAPFPITTADPIKVCVSQDGTNTGADPGSTQGAAILYLKTATPA